MLLAKTYQMLDNVTFRDNESRPEDQTTQYDISSCNEVHQSTQIEGLATLTAYKNGAVKAQFLDRTIVRMHSTFDWIQILNSKGDELTFRQSMVTKENNTVKDYFNYI